ncbi:HEAT repeat domain-containing protein, partial [Kitasatospora sp. NPDC050543]|uniref:HEAT repeat domain-containing protein n=1 Tax=Kitasatospora sp. NPDC050543 TaxID=3364054 RepID=UPI00379FED47
IGHPQAIPALTTALTDDTDAKVRGSAANALGHIGDPGALEALTTALADDTDANVRGSAANALGRIGHPQAIPALTTALADDTDGHTRTSAANALGRIGDPGALEALTTALADDTDGHTRGAAATSLGRVNAAGALTPLIDALLRDTNAIVRGSAANALGHLGNPAAAEVLRATIENPEETYRTRRAAVASLTHLDTGDEAWITKVADRLRFTARDRNRRALRGAIVDLVAHREINPKAKDWLVNVIHKDKDPKNRTTALEGLARAGRADAELIKFIIAPEHPRPDKRPRDSDTGVLGAAGAAVVRAAADQPAYTESLLPSVVHMLTQRDTHRAAVITPLTQLRLLPLPVADRTFSRIVQLMGDNMPENPRLESALAAERESLAERRRVQANIDSFTAKPEAVLAAFREHRKSRFEMTASRIDEKCHVALLTAVPVETTALFHVLDERGIIREPVQRDGRYYQVFQLVPAGKPPIQVITTQATNQGGQSAAAVTHALLSTFRPDLVFLVGVCGGFDERNVSLGDVLLARQVFEYEPEKVQLEGGGLRPQGHLTDEQVLRLVASLHADGKLNASLDGRKLLTKDFASGEKVIARRDSELRGQLLELSTEIAGVETESHGVLHTIWEWFKAKEFVGGTMLKCVSDLGDEEMTVDKEAKQTEAAQRAARVALDIVGAFHRADA